MQLRWHFKKLRVVQYVQQPEYISVYFKISVIQQHARGKITLYGNLMILNAVYELWKIFPKRSTVPKTFVIVGKSSEVFGNLRLISGILSSAIFDLKPRMTVGSHSESSYFFRHLRCNLQTTFRYFQKRFSDW